ncbi:MAG: PASTA domain-containing protein [Planctomycetaceae bacterium]|jgi:TIGR03009 family protein
MLNRFASLCVIALLTFCLMPAVRAVPQAAAAGTPRVSPMDDATQAAMDQLLQEWSENSDGIKRLEGRVLRIVYDNVFESESRASGKVYYEKPDKGRMDLNGVPLDGREQQQRLAAAAQAIKAGRQSPIRLKKTGEPYDLKQIDDKIWSCDGQRIYELDVKKEEAVVAPIPARMQGANIMDGPLPFLFGMPPEQAKRRFEMGFHNGKPPVAGATRIQLIVYPNLGQDAEQWHHADVILSLETYLPVAVRMHNSAESQETVWSFEDVQVNPLRLFGDPYTPNLRGYKVKQLQEQMAGPNQNPGQKLVPNLIGRTHSEAQGILEKLGLKRDKEQPELSQILILKGSRTNDPQMQYRVESQDPPADTPINSATKVTMRLLIP